MKDNSLYKLGGIASILVGISYVVIGITGALIPTKLGGVPDVQSPLMYWDANKTMLLTQWWAMLIGAVFALAMIPAVSSTLRAPPAAPRAQSSPSARCFGIASTP